MAKVDLPKEPDNTAASTSVEAPEVREPEAEAKPKATTRSPSKELTGVKYIGRADVKHLSVQDFVSVGVKDPKMDLRWDSQNDHIVGIKDVNASTLEYLRSQPDFRVV